MKRIQMENFTMVDFNYFDVTIGAIIILLAIKGFMNGVIKEIFSLVGFIGGFYFASRMADDAAIFIGNHFMQIENIVLKKLIGFMSVLIIVWLIAMILGVIFSKLVSANKLGFINHLLGFIVGGGKYFMIFAFIVTTLSNVALIRENTQQYIKDSILYPLLRKAGTNMIYMNPTSFDPMKIAPKSIEKYNINPST
ncbi:MAG: CvpA family protein [Sulfurovum sp.]|nr:CvpA family protein [Sulfurovum sp.]